jgi:hypothetical protein
MTVNLALRRGLGLAASAAVVGAAIAACRPTGDTGYVEIRTVPIMPVTQVALFLDLTRLAPIKKGNAILREATGTLKLQVESAVGALVPLCDVVVKRNRVTTVTVSVLERPPRCVCRYSAPGGAARVCVS